MMDLTIEEMKREIHWINYNCDICRKNFNSTCPHKDEKITPDLPPCEDRELI